MRLEAEQVDLLRELAEAARTAMRDDRLFMCTSTLAGSFLQGPLNRAISDAEVHDLHDLESAGLLRIRRQNVSGDFDFTVTPEAHDFLAQQAPGTCQVE